MDTGTQGAAGYYVWEIPGKPIAVYLHLDVVDRMLAEVMRGFGAVPKRGAEVGGVLLGTVEHGNPSIVRVEDFEPVDCDYKRGPSYLFVDEDRNAFEDACHHWQPGGSNPVYAVGYFRSHTRDGLALSPEDIELLDRHFPSPAHIALLIKPYATKVSAGGFFFREDGVFQETTPLEFPFRRREITGEEAPPRRSMMERRPRARGSRSMAPAVVESDNEIEEEDYMAGGLMRQPELAYAVTAPSRSRLRSGWVWIPLSFIFLLLGVVLGFQTALTMGSRLTGGAAQDFSLALSVGKSDDNLSVKWDRTSPAIRTSQRGTLEIEDGDRTQSVDLDAAQLQNGSLVYRNTSNTVRFRLIVYPNTRVSVTETLDWQQP